MVTPVTLAMIGKVEETLTFENSSKSFTFNLPGILELVEVTVAIPAFAAVMLTIFSTVERVD